MGAELNLDLWYLHPPLPDHQGWGHSRKSPPRGTAGAPARAARAEPALPGLAEPEELVELVLGKGLAARPAPAAKPRRERRRDVGIAAHPGPATGTISGSWGSHPRRRFSVFTENFAKGKVLPLPRESHLCQCPHHPIPPSHSHSKGRTRWIQLTDTGQTITPRDHKNKQSSADFYLFWGG